jgi:hypothetical protein
VIIKGETVVFLHEWIIWVYEIAVFCVVITIMRDVDNFSSVIEQVLTGFPLCLQSDIAMEIPIRLFNYCGSVFR